MSDETISQPRHLAYLIAVDAPGCGGQRTMAKMLVSSLLRTGWAGDIMVFHNGEAPMFLTPRAGLDEVALELDSPGGVEGANLAWRMKYQVAGMIPAERYARILFLDADCMVLRDVGHLLAGDWDISVQVEQGVPINEWTHYSYLTEKEMVNPGTRNGMNSGTWAVRGSVYKEVTRGRSCGLPSDCGSRRSCSRTRACSFTSWRCNGAGPPKRGAKRSRPERTSLRWRLRWPDFLPVPGNRYFRIAHCSSYTRRFRLPSE